ncbi:MAG TPA: FG-GAP repeat protein [Pyrinomonadaceae bacterium]|nr:FG-GAP repeat protein [Pyrinomonadaceae bacterium]
MTSSRRHGLSTRRLSLRLFIIGILAICPAALFITGVVVAAAGPSFATKADYATGVAPGSVAIGDFNLDGKPDLAVANSYGETVSVLINVEHDGRLQGDDPWVH